MTTFFKTGIALSPRKTNFGPVMFSGRLEEGLEVVHQAGFSFIELSIRTKDDLEPKAFKQSCNELELNVTAVATGQACLFDDLCLGSDDTVRQQMAVDHFKEIADFAKEINSGAIIIGGIRGSLSKDGEYDELYARGIEAFRSCAEWTESIGIPLLIEPINRYETNWIYTAEEGRQVLDAIGMDSVKLLLDTFHMNIEEANMVKAIRETGNQLGYVHFADNTRHAPGQGQTDFKAVLSVLEDIDYQGPIVAECLPLPDDWSAVMNTAKFWKQICGQDLS